MKKFILPLLLLALVSCQSNTPKTEEEKFKQQETQVIKAKNFLAVKGMTCKFACGGAIKKALKKVDGVAAVDLDFEEGRTENVFTVSLNKAIDQQNLVAAVEGLMDGIYQVSDVK